MSGLSKPPTVVNLPSEGNDGSFKKGDKRPRSPKSGRQKGQRKTQGTRDAVEFAQKFTSSPRYRDNLMKRILLGSAPQMEVLLHYQAWGKPKLTIAVEKPPESDYDKALQRMSTEELLELAKLQRARRAILTAARARIIDVKPLPLPPAPPPPAETPPETAV